MLILGIILMVAGLGSAIYGIIDHNSLTNQISSALGGSSSGTIFIIIGVVALVAGIALTVIGARKKNN